MIYGFITVRASSSRLPNKCLLNFGNFTVLGHVIERLRSYSIKPVVCTTTNKNDYKIIEISNSHKCKYFRGSEYNKIKDGMIAKYLNINEFHTVDCDDPFFCGNEIERSMNLLLKNKLDLVKPYKESTSGPGILGYSIKTDLLKKINIIKDDNIDTEMIDPYFRDYLVVILKYSKTKLKS